MTTTLKLKPRLLTQDEKDHIMQTVETAALKTFLESVREKGEDAKDFRSMMHNRRVQLGELCYQLALTKAEKKYIVEHADWFHASSTISVVLLQERRKERFTFTMAERRLLPLYLCERNYNYRDDERPASMKMKDHFFDPLSAVAIGLKSIQEIEQRHTETIHKATQQLRGVLYGKVTAVNVMERWPGIVQAYPDIKQLAKETNKSLVVMTDVLNAALGIAPPAVAAK